MQGAMLGELHARENTRIIVWEGGHLAVCPALPGAILCTCIFGAYPGVLPRVLCCTCTWERGRVHCISGHLDTCALDRGCCTAAVRAVPGRARRARQLLSLPRAGRAPRVLRLRAHLPPALPAVTRHLRGGAAWWRLGVPLLWGGPEGAHNLLQMAEIA